jgi:hypothetical protein
VAFFLRAVLEPRRVTSSLVAAFRLHSSERAFALELLRRKTNLWVFRQNQRAFCGDFAIVDMSSPDPKQRAVWILDLKLGAPLRLGGGGAGVQLVNAAQAVAALGRRHGVVGRDAPYELLTGDALAVLGYLSE